MEMYKTPIELPDRSNRVRIRSGFRSRRSANATFIDTPWAIRKPKTPKMCRKLTNHTLFTSFLRMRFVQIN